MFYLPGRKQLLKSDMEYEVVVIDATETPIQRPKKSKNNSTQVRKSDIPSRTQLIVDKKTTEIICTSYKNGKCHDYRLFKESGIKGLQKVHVQTLLLRKRVKRIRYRSKIRRTIQV